MNVVDVEQRHGSGVYGKRDLVMATGEGFRLWDARGREYIDCVAGIGVANVGHCHPRLQAALAAQAETLWSCPEMFYNERRAALLQRLVRHLPPGLERIYLCNSGTEAVEAALKFARLSSGRPGVVAAMRGFHGRTMGSLSATHARKYCAPFTPLVPHFQHVPFGNLERLAGALSAGNGQAETGAVILEVVQGEGGVRPGSPAYFQGVQQLCRERDILLIIDEVQTGFGRTGRWFACEHVGVVPDLLCMGKALGGGVPVGAVALGPGVKQLAPGVHGSTFGGNPLACAAALATMEVIAEEGLVQRAARLGELFMAQLAAVPSPLIREVRGLGLMVGVELRCRARPVVDALSERGVLALTAGSTVLRLLPPLVISEEALGHVAAAIGEALGEVEEVLGREQAGPREVSV
jgi:acetylornithine/LysW-gamma-L-lysine aminotransferase